MEETFGKRLAKARKIKGLKQNELGKIIGVSGQAIGKYEQDRGKPEVANLISISKVLDVSIDYLFKGTNTRPPESNEIVEVLKGRVEDKQKIIYQNEEKINMLQEEIAKYKTKK